MHRRELFRLLGAGAVLPAIPPDLFAMLRSAQPGEGYALRSLDAYQNATTVAMIDLLIPETETPGAKGARVNEFIDLILTDWATPEEKNHFWMDSRISISRATISTERSLSTPVQHIRKRCSGRSMTWPWRTGVGPCATATPCPKRMLK